MDAYFGAKGKTGQTLLAKLAQRAKQDSTLLVKLAEDVRVDVEKYLE